MDKSLEGIYKGIIEGDQVATAKGVQSALADGLNPEVILKDSLIAAMSEVGRLFEACEYYVPELLISARAMQTGLKILKPQLITTGVKATGRVVIGTAAGDLHDIGKNLVGMMMEGAGFEVIDLGTDVKAEQYVEAVRQHHPDLVGISALLTTTMLNMTAVIQALEAAGLRGQVKVMVGGAPVTQEYAQKIGADGFAADASLAVKTAVQLMGSG
jgi:5-methyltetrahydrofolate--homocysteine methyltransferase